MTGTSDDFQKKLSTALQPVRVHIRQEHDAERQKMQESHQRKVEEAEKRAKAAGVQCRFRDQYIKPCYTAIEKEITGGSGKEYGEPHPEWSFRFDYDKARIELMIEYGDCCFRVIARAYIGEEPVHNESIQFSEDEFQPEEAGEWLQEQAIECAKLTLAGTNRM